MRFCVELFVAEMHRKWINFHFQFTKPKGKILNVACDVCAAWCQNQIALALSWTRKAQLNTLSIWNFALSTLFSRSEYVDVWRISWDLRPAKLNIKLNPISHLFNGEGCSAVPFPSKSPSTTENNVLENFHKWISSKATCACETRGRPSQTHTILMEMIQKHILIWIEKSWQPRPSITLKHSTPNTIWWSFRCVLSASRTLARQTEKISQI